MLTCRENINHSCSDPHPGSIGLLCSAGQLHSFGCRQHFIEAQGGDSQSVVDNLCTNEYWVAKQLWLQLVWKLRWPCICMYCKVNESKTARIRVILVFSSQFRLKYCLNLTISFNYASTKCHSDLLSTYTLSQQDLQFWRQFEINFAVFFSPLLFSWLSVFFDIY